MTVVWGAVALDDRTAMLADALARAIAAPDPQIYAAACAQDERIEVEAATLDGAAIYQQGPLPDSRLYVMRDGLFVILYRRTGRKVLIERVCPARSNWKPVKP